MKLKRLLFSLPLLVFLFFLIAFLIAERNFGYKVNQLALTSSGDAEKLNPILYTDAASGTIIDLVFNGLIKYNEHLELVADLAESWTIVQISTIFLKPDGGLKADEAIFHLKDTLSARQLKELQIKGFRVVSPLGFEIHLDTAGRAFEEEILKVIPAEKIQPVKFIYVAVDTDKKFADGKSVSAQETLRRLKEKIDADEVLRSEILKYRVERSDLFVVKMLGKGDRLLSLIDSAIKLPPGELDKEQEPPLGSILKIEKALVDNSPIITFHLRKGVRWHDEAPFTAEDVKFTYEKIMDEKTNTVRRPMFELVDTLEITDPYTVRVKYKKPFSPSLETWTMGIIPKHILENEDINTTSFNRHPIGTGPFKFKEWLSDQKISVVANQDYFRGPPNLDQISMRIIPESSLREMAFIIKGVDYYGVEAHQYRRFSVDEGFKVYMTPANGYTYIGWNMKVPLFADKRVRRALTYAINRQEIVDYLLFGLGRIATGPYPHHMWYYNPDVKPLEYDPEKAKRLLREAGWEDTNGDGFLDKGGKRFKFTLITNNGNPVRKNITELVQRQLKEIGIEVGIALYEWSVFVSDKINARDYEACVLGWGLSLDPDIYELWHSSQAEKGFNFVSYSNPKVDRLIEAGRTEYDREKRKEIYYKIHFLIAEDQPYTFLYVPESTPALHQDTFKIKTVDASGRPVLEEIKMTKYGLTYFLEKWVRVGAHSLSPEI